VLGEGADADPLQHRGGLRCRFAPPEPKKGRFIWGLLLMTLGLFQKTVLADTLLAGSADTVFNYGGPLNSLDAWTGVLAFSGQIFFDFAGYSHIAIGSARLLGIILPENFDFPYLATSPRDFWRRWHIGRMYSVRHSPVLFRAKIIL
jgi:alginate O-acetyltransferase complex protein AlgI